MASNTVPASALSTRIIAKGALCVARGAARLVQSWRSWGYAGDKRDLSLDLLRGFAAMTMIIDHIGGKDSWLYTISGGA